MKKLILISGMLMLWSGFTYAQIKSSMAVKDLSGSIEKYISKNYEGFKPVEAFKYETCYEVNIQKGGTTEGLVFDAKGNFLMKTTESMIPVRTRTTIAIKDLNGSIEKYVKKNYDGYMISEAYFYDIAYSVKIVKGNESEFLLFDKDGKFEKKISEPAVMKEEPKATGTEPVKKETKEEPVKADTTKK